MASLVKSSGRKYASDYIKDVEFYKDIPEIDTKVIALVNSLAAKVGAPNYIKTPVFPKNIRLEKSRANDRYSNEHWEDLRNFKEHKIVVKTDTFEILADEVRVALNKITGETFQSNLDLIREKINTLGGDEEKLTKITGMIFEIASTNKFWTTLYGDLCHSLSKTIPDITKTCIKNFKTFHEMFKNIEYISPEENYDEFCRINKNNEKRRALCKLFATLTKHGILSVNDTLDLIIGLFDKLLTHIDVPNHINQNEEISENIFLFVQTINSYGYAAGNTKWETIVAHIGHFANDLKAKEHVSLTNKMVFQMEDLMDEL